jgi:two-component system, LytTR family, response regulator
MSVQVYSPAPNAATHTEIRAVVATALSGSAELRSVLQHDHDVHIVADCLHAQQAANAIHEHAPDLLLMDASLADADHVVALASVCGVPAILVTGCDTQSEARFATVALECLPRACPGERVEVALLRAKCAVQRARLESIGQRGPESRDVSSPPLERLVVKADHALIVVRVADVDWIRSAGNYVWIHTGNECYRLRHTISGLFALLNSGRFVRVHRCAIVNLDRVVRFHIPSRGNAYALLQTGVQLPLSRGYRRALKQLQHR